MAPLFTLWVVVSSTVAAAPPVLTDPAAAASWAGKRVGDFPLQAAEIAWLARDAVLAERALNQAPPSPRRDRLLVDLALSQGTAGPWDTLAEAPGWGQHAAHARAVGQAQQWERYGIRVGVGLYALALAALGLIGARELLRLTWETGLLAAVWVAAVLLTQHDTQGAGIFAMLVGLASLTLGHAAAACMRRLRPGPRWRLMALALVAMGVLGVATAATLRLGPGRLFG